MVYGYTKPKFNITISGIAIKMISKFPKMCVLYFTSLLNNVFKHEITTLEVTPRILGLSANVFFYISPNFYFFRINPIVYVRYGISNYKETIN